VPTGAAIEEVGFYDPRDTVPLEVKTDRVEHWVKQGAQLSDAVKRLLARV
jgi:ribosomal protein S16